MSYISGPQLDVGFPPFAVLREQLGFVPRVYRDQALAPRLVEAETGLVAAVLFRNGSLPRLQKEQILLMLAGLNGNAYWTAAQYQILSLMGVSDVRIDQIVADYRQALLPPADLALLRFAAKLGKYTPFVSRKDTGDLLQDGYGDGSALEAVLTVALSSFLNTLATGLGVTPDFAPRPGPPPEQDLFADLHDLPRDEGTGPYLRAAEPREEDSAPFTFFRDIFGFIPAVFRAQTLRPDVIAAEADLIRVVLLSQDLLTRKQKEFLMLAVSAANLNTYGVALHSEFLAQLGVSKDVSDVIVENHRQANIPERDKGLLDFARQLTLNPRGFGRETVDALLGHGFREEQILEAIAAVSLANFFNTLQMGLGAKPDFAPARAFPSAQHNIAYLSARDSRHNQGGLAEDPDARLVLNAQSGNLDAFEELMTRHSKRVYRTLIGVLGDPDEARDAMQDTFLKAFQHMGGFQGRSKFSTWLVSIAGNTGIERLRERKPLESLDYENLETEEGFRPRQVQSWTANPEQLYSKTEMRALLESRIMALPAKYRVVVLLRDLEELTTAEAAAALGLGVAATKARLLRGRLMLREALAPHFAARTKEAMS